MTKQSIEPSYFALGTKKESARGSSVAWGSAVPFLLKHMEDHTLPKPGEIVTDKDEYTGSPQITEWSIRRWMVEREFRSRLLPHHAALFGSLVGGSVSSALVGASLAYKHTITTQTGVSLATVTGWEKSPTIGEKVIAGIGCRALRITGKRGDKDAAGDFCRVSAQIVGDGSFATGVDISGGSYPTSEAYLDYSDVEIKVGGTFNGTTVSDGTSIRSKVKDFELALINNASAEFSFGNSDGYADDLVIGDTKIDNLASLRLNLEPEDATEINRLAAETEAVVQIVITGALIESGYYFTVDAVLPRTRTVDAVPGRDGTIQVVNPLVFQALYDNTNSYNAWYMFVTNKVTEYLGAVA